MVLLLLQMPKISELNIGKNNFRTANIPKIFTIIKELMQPTSQLFIEMSTAQKTLLLLLSQFSAAWMAFLKEDLS